MTPIMNYWMDILCMGETAEKQELFIKMASENRYHRICDCLEKLKWDGEQRIDKLLLRYLGANNDNYTKEIMRLLMLAAIHRVYELGCKFEIMVCLVGGQGAGKSTFSAFLL